ncbi:hypothetical protein [Mycoplana ramosa]|uniref:Mu-like prophage FluMu N-terminal domain-containing protein n=1 Tax=Mycoplana ramosa TaxID=40837 RepID=A0ABW3Z1Y1_MYCRA
MVKPAKPKKATDLALDQGTAIASTNTPESDRGGEAGDGTGLSDQMERMSEETFRARYPLTAELIDRLSPFGKTAWVLRVTSKQAGFRRGGFAHPAEPVDHDLAQLHPDQVEAILGEPMLVAEVETPDGTDR